MISENHRSSCYKGRMRLNGKLTIAGAGILIAGSFLKWELEGLKGELVEIRGELISLQHRVEAPEGKYEVQSTTTIGVTNHAITKELKTDIRASVLTDSKEEPFYTQKDDDTLVYRDDAKLDIGSDMMVSSPSGVMLSNRDQTLIYGDLLITDKTTGGSVHMAVRFDKNGKLRMHTERSRVLIQED